MSSEHVSRYNDAVRSAKCYFCPRRDSLETHHIVPRRKNGGDNEENLVIVCERCHRKLETLYDKAFYDRLGVGDERGERRSHYACTASDCTNAATKKVRNSHGYVDWWCDEHATPLLDSPDATVLEEATEVTA